MLTKELHQPLPTVGALGREEKAKYELPSKEQPKLAFTSKDNLKRKQPNEGLPAVAGRPESEMNYSDFRDNREYASVYEGITTTDRRELVDRLMKDTLEAAEFETLTDAQELPRFRGLTGIEQTDKPQVFWKQTKKGSDEVLLIVRLNNGKPNTSIFMNVRCDERGYPQFTKQSQQREKRYFHLGTDEDYDKSKKPWNVQFHTVKGRWLRGASGSEKMEKEFKEVRKKTPEDYWKKRDEKLTSGRSKKKSLNEARNLEVILEKRGEEQWIDQWERRDKIEQWKVEAMQKVLLIDLVAGDKLRRLQEAIKTKGVGVSISAEAAISKKLKELQPHAEKFIKNLIESGREVSKQLMEAASNIAESRKK